MSSNCRYSHVVPSQPHMPAIRTDNSECDSAITYTRYKKGRWSARRKTIEPYPSNSHSSHQQSPTEPSTISSEGTISSSNSARVASVHSPKSQFVGPITVCGVRLSPTVAFDTFWRFAAERKAIDDRRRAGEPAP